MAADKSHSGPPGILTYAQLEQIAALIDERLEGDERADALRLLRESGEAYRVFVESLAQIGGTGHGALPAAQPASEASSVAEPTPDSAPFDAAGPWHGIPGKAVNDLVAAIRATPTWKTVLPLAAAASVAVLLMLPAETDFSPDRLAGSLGAEGLFVGLAAEHPISPSRGATVAASDLGHAFRLGVSVMDAEGAIRTNRTDEAGVTMELILTLLDDLGASGPVVVPFREVRDGAGELADADRDVERWLSVQPSHLARYQFGKGSEVVRFAMVAGNDPFVTGSGIDYLDVGRRADLSGSADERLSVLISLIDDGNFSVDDEARMLTLLEGVMAEAAR